MADTDSDIDVKVAKAKKNVKIMPNSPSSDVVNNNTKKTTKSMITDALIEIKSRKGTSVYAIKKYLHDKFQVDTERLNYVIKKSLKSGVEDGTFVQLKGIGASGSFKLANVKPEKKKSKKKTEPENAKGEKIKKKKIAKSDSKVEKTAADKPKIKKAMSKPTKKTEGSKPEKKSETKVTKKKKETKVIEDTEEKVKKSKVKPVKEAKAPTKKQKIMMKRKSIGSIIKAPKMKPKNA